MWTHETTRDPRAIILSGVEGPGQLLRWAGQNRAENWQAARAVYCAENQAASLTNLVTKFEDQLHADIDAVISEEQPATFREALPCLLRVSKPSYAMQLLAARFTL